VRVIQDSRSLESDEDSTADDTEPPELTYFYDSDEDDDSEDSSKLNIPDTQDPVNRLTRTFLENLKFHAKPDQITAALTLKEYKGKLKVWDERTSISPVSNMHLGHLKAYFSEHTYKENSDEAADLEDCRQKILRGHLLLLNYALQVIRTTVGKP
jgi:hypothetical protein